LPTLQIFSAGQAIALPIRHNPPWAEPGSENLTGQSPNLFASGEQVKFLLPGGGFETMQNINIIK